ncbi:lecithin retinol acyltransferase family protein [Citrobacter enshiensis]|uniref:lecithin retinol acyltransferase family protein n=1 Tax=Citrobacter enshiensis TaxID=2971264 RepID=UPI0023E8918F|nr:lecithin retinol acyltransferase family protein [Citrobacter enshiensis]WET41337.1 lecithin retinol acyltransferase family protein [Citrobacter enshiensis]
MVVTAELMRQMYIKVEIMGHEPKYIKEEKIRRGCVIRSELSKLGFTFYHFGIYAGNEKVIHFSDGVVKREALDHFVEKFERYFDIMALDEKHTSEFSLEKSYQRARQCLGMSEYSLLKNNCEHFALWCRTGKALSSQSFGSESQKISSMDHFNRIKIDINTPGIMSYFNNKLGMQTSRRITLDKNSIMPILRRFLM